MSIKHENTICIYLLIPAFLLGGFLHVALYGVDFCDCICQIYYSVLALIWGITIEMRINNKRIRNLLFDMVGLAVLMFTFQICKYKLLGNNLNALRYVWYCYYVPIILAPCCMFRIALLVGNETKGRIARILNISTYCGALLLIMLVMTNDLHQFIFKFHNGVINGVNDYSHGIGFYLIYAWVVLLYAVSLIVITRKCRVMDSKMMAWLPVVPTIISVVCEILTIMGKLKYNGITIWQLGEIYFMSMIGFLEAGFVVGLIPTNFGYERLLDLTNKPIVIADSEGNIVYKSVQYKELANNPNNYSMSTDRIKGGTISWGVDMSSIFRLNHEIEETTLQIESRNEYLHTQNDMKEEQSKIDARNNLYDNMAKIMSPQIDRINKLLNEDGSSFDNNLREIAVLNAYIKRRSNMELLYDNDNVLSLKELHTALSESCDYIKLCGVKALVAPTQDTLISGELIIACYDFFEGIVEKSLSKLQFLMITISYDKERLAIRFLLNADCCWSDSELLSDKIKELGGSVTVSCQDEDTSILLTFETGGAR